MTIEFEVEYVLRRSPTVVLARILEPQAFTLVHGATLGGVPIQPVVTIPRALDKNGNPRTDVYAFTLGSGASPESLTRGACVILAVPPN